jgi:hypothetical protein
MQMNDNCMMVVAETRNSNFPCFRRRHVRISRPQTSTMEKIVSPSVTVGEIAVGNSSVEAIIHQGTTLLSFKSRKVKVLKNINDVFNDKKILN